MLKLPPKPFWVVHDVMWVCTKEDKYKQVCTAVCRLLCSFLWSFSFPLFLCHSCLIFRVCVRAVLTSCVKMCGAEALTLVAELKEQDSLATADSSGLRAALGSVLDTAQVNAYLLALLTKATDSLTDWTKLISMLGFPAVQDYMCGDQRIKNMPCSWFIAFFFFSVLEICSACTWYRAAQLGPVLLKGTSWGLAVLRFTCFRSRKSVLKHCPFLSSAQSEEKYILLAKLQTAR